jgi:hypothetical protein
MPTAERTLTIAAPLETVFAFFTTPENDLLWREELVKATPEGPFGLYALVREQVSAAVIGEVASESEFTEWDAPHGYSF